MWGKDREWAIRITEEELAKWAGLPQRDAEAKDKITGEVRRMLDGLAFNLDLTPEEMLNRLKAGDPNQIARQQALLDRIGNSMGKSRSKPPKPERMFTQFHKRRKPPSKAELGRRADRFLKWKKAVDAINTEEATPLDS